MTRNAAYRNQPCGYCGQNTADNGHGEHVFPACMYPAYLRTPQFSGSRFPPAPNAIVHSNGLKLTPETLLSLVALMPPLSVANFGNMYPKPPSQGRGKEDGLAILAQLAANDNANGHPQDPTLPASTSARTSKPAAPEWDRRTAKSNGEKSAAFGGVDTKPHNFFARR